MFEELSSDEFEGWELAYQQEPWGDKRADQRALVHALWDRWTKDSEWEPPDALFPYWKTPEQKAEAELKEYKAQQQLVIDAEKRMKDKQANG